MTLPLFDQGPMMESKMPATLRPYQSKLIRALRGHVVTGKRRILCVLPTGAGKMFIIANIFKTATVPVLFIAHRQELINQCANQLAKLGITNIGVIRGDDDRVNPSATIQIASIQTLARRDKPPAGIIVIDEAHRAASDSYKNILDLYPDAILFGFTASPTRLDGRPLGGDLFHIMEIGATYAELLKRPDWLVAPDVYSSEAALDLSSVREKNGDFDEGALGQIMSHDQLIGNIVEHWMKLAHRHPVFDAKGQRVPFKSVEGERRRTFLFAVNIAHSHKLCAEFEKAGVRIAHLDGNTPDNERAAILRDIGSGALEIVSNCNVLLEGVDVPSVKCIIHARPTKSLVLWMQSTGRIMRPWNKVVPLLLDHAQNFDRLGAPFEDRVWSLKDRPGRIRSSAPMKLCKQCFAYINISKMVCPFCKWEFPIGSDAMKTPEEVSADLALANAEAPELKKRHFEAMATLARAKGYKPGFASAKYKEKYGMWPPYAWSDGLKAAFGEDKFWQETFAKNQEKKAQRAAHEAAEQAAMAKRTAEDKDLRWMDVPPDDSVSDEEFNEWVRGEGIE